MFLKVATIPNRPLYPDPSKNLLRTKQADVLWYTGVLRNSALELPPGISHEVVFQIGSMWAGTTDAPAEQCSLTQCRQLFLLNITYNLCTRTSSGGCNVIAIRSYNASILFQQMLTVIRRGPSRVS